MKSNITLIVLTYNEELNLEKCLRSVDGLVSEIIIVDSGSTDKTKEISEKYGARFVVHEFKNQADQFNWALDNIEIKGDWVMRLDADEELLPELKKEIEEKISGLPEGVSGVVLRRRTYFLGKWMKHGGIYPTELLRIFRKGRGASENREMDEHLILKDGESVIFKNDFIDNNLSPLKSWLSKHRNYAKREARVYFKELQADGVGDVLNSQAGGKRHLKNRVYYSLPPFFRALAYFIYRYFIKLGFLDGFNGFLYCFLHALWYRSLVDLEIIKLKHFKSK